MKSRKENRLLHGSNDGSQENTPTVDHLEMRKVSQPAALTRETTCTTASPPSDRTFSGVFSQRSVSAGEFGNDITNTINNDAGSIAIQSLLGSEKGLKRTRTFTPASAKAIDDEDEPRRPSPRVRLSFGENAGGGN